MPASLDSASRPRPSGSSTRRPAGILPRLPRAYRNPVLDRDFPDPTVIRASDGWYYAYATQTPAPRTNVQAARSRDLVRWDYLGEVLPELPAWASRSEACWAPDVAEHAGRFVLFFSVTRDGDPREQLCLATAVADSPRGPFEAGPAPLYQGPARTDIDLQTFRDPADGAWYAYWGSAGDIVGRPLAPDLLGFAPGSSPILLLRGWSARRRRPYEHGIEGPFVTHHDGWYFLFYSGDNCCEYPPSYAVMVARAAGPLGPFERLGDARGAPSSAILEANRRWLGPGHNSVIDDRAGRHWIAYHAVDPRADRRHRPDGRDVRRVMLLDELTYEDGWPRVGDGTPSTGPRPAPAG
jgi:arabinan endo-1,5-alpha-L-arabinosidase